MFSGIVNAGGVIVSQAIANKLRTAQSAMAKKHMEQMQQKVGWPRLDAVCQSKAHHTPRANMEIDSETCNNCAGTNRMPIPWKEVMS